MIPALGLLGWVGLATGSTISAAAIPLVNQHARAERLSMLFWLRVFMLVIALPILCIVGWPGDPVFYVATFATAFIWAYSDLAGFRVTEQFGPGPVTRLIPLNVLVTYVMYAVVQPDVLYSYCHDPLRALAIAVALSATVFFAMRLQSLPAPREALHAIGPIVLMSGIGVVFAKIALDHASPASGVFGYMAVQAFFMVIIFGALEALWQPVPRAVFAGRVAMKAGLLMGAVSFVHLLFKSYAYRMVENPAYVSAIVLTTPFWIMLYYKIARNQVIGDLKAALAVVASAAILIAAVVLL